MNEPGAADFIGFENLPDRRVIAAGYPVKRITGTHAVAYERRPRVPILDAGKRRRERGFRALGNP